MRPAPMIWHVRQRLLLHAVLAVGLIAWAAPRVVADEAAYCVTCSGPDQTYLCRVTAGGSRPSDALKLYCVIRTAKEGHHASCSAERNSPNCNGAEKVYSYDGPMPEDFASDPRVKHFTDKIEQDQHAFDKPKSDAPKTLVELGGRAVSGLRNARHALTGSLQPADQPLPGKPLALEEQNAAVPAQTAPGPNLDAPHLNRVQRAYRCMKSFFRHCSSEPIR